MESGNRGSKLGDREPKLRKVVSVSLRIRSYETFLKKAKKMGHTASGYIRFLITKDLRQL